MVWLQNLKIFIRTALLAEGFLLYFLLIPDYSKEASSIGMFSNVCSGVAKAYMQLYLITSTLVLAKKCFQSLHLQTKTHRRQERVIL